MELSNRCNDNLNISEIDLSKYSPANSSLYTSPNWLKLLANYYNYKFWQTNSGSPNNLILTEAQCLIGRKLVSMPFSDYVCPNISPQSLANHIKVFNNRFQQLPIILKLPESYASPAELSFLGRPVAKNSLHRVAVAARPESSMSNDFKKDIKIALNNKLSDSVSKSDSGLKVFYNLYYKHKTEKSGTIPKPYSFFKLFHELFVNKQKAFYLFVSHKHSPVAGAIVIQHANTYYLKWACSLERSLILRPNNLLFCSLMHLASENGISYVDLGGNKHNENHGLTKFKLGVGAQDEAIYTYKQTPLQYPGQAEERLKSLVGEMAGIVVQNHLSSNQTQSFSRALQPLLV